MSEHDTQGSRERFPSEPSPFASEAGAAALISRSGPPDRWPTPFSQSSNFVYGTRGELYGYGVMLETDAARQIRLDGLERRLHAQYGPLIGDMIFRGQDICSVKDLDRWKHLGSSLCRVFT